MQQGKLNINVACVGEAMAELMLGSDEDQTPLLGFAGDTMNTAIYLNRMLDEASQVSYITVLGEDALSDRLIRRLNDESVKTSRIRRSKTRLVGLYAITTDAEGERTFSYWRSESAARTLFQEESKELQCNFDVLSGFDIIFLSAITLAILPNAVRVALLAELARLRNDEHVRVVFDSNYRPALWESADVARETIAATWRITDIALPSIDDEMMLFNDADEAALLARFQGYGVVKGALKRGELGPRSLNGSVDQSIHESSMPKEATPASEIKVVDTTAAGDSFNAGYLSSILNGKDEQDALQAGHACACRVISHRGAIIPRDQW